MAPLSKSFYDFWNHHDDLIRNYQQREVEAIALESDENARDADGLLLGEELLGEPACSMCHATKPMFPNGPCFSCIIADNDLRLLTYLYDKTAISVLSSIKPSNKHLYYTWNPAHASCKECER